MDARPGGRAACCAGGTEVGGGALQAACARALAIGRSGLAFATAPPICAIPTATSENASRMIAVTATAIQPACRRFTLPTW